ncbi:ATP-grasp domain-containing protein [Tuanshanicoccus lijuaniae]|uniref:ATP-grasp domain-containing protein n=1 Tax=Aerococcaceae bacterium zg-1292 TaxID=2774330 RepID=UPI001938CCDF|nr:ATP-grasp domain-containing protein [Aerococcaceae bacterium zg-1292]MBF6625037.1 ATP-grasp domain-containing protein [Aerococcaceae bacterium zg-BR9]MBF6626304.1 ATP-grasp domain-containing protein [Aerococcaceae bacterium zg-BR9]MBF6978152.1 ATP-grasp domain-containing protein [Aerococcaceae bacterium zg-BR22]QQA37558.1 ATP-grasp domain-containing protein [Aerococcaceae bacterium zg-1292]
MSVKYFPGSTIGIIGSSIASAILAQEAGRLGYRVGSLVLVSENPVHQFTSWQTIAENYNELVLRQFAERVDIVIAETGLLSPEDYHVLKEVTNVVLSDDLISLVTDRLLEKVYLDSLHLLVAPFSLVTSLNDIKEAIEYIGFPCILKSTNRHLPNSENSIVLYSEDDYEAAAQKVEESSCILEAWIPTVKKAVLTVVRNERGELLIYPIFERINTGEGSQVRYPITLHSAIEQEIARIGQLVAEAVGLIGSLTIECLITAAGVVYINKAAVGLAEEAIFTVGSMSVSHFEAMIRALVGLPLPSLRPRSLAAISLPLQNLEIENVLTQYMLRTDWGFAFFNPVGQQPEDLVGQVIVTGESIANCERQIELTEIIKKPL